MIQGFSVPSAEAYRECRPGMADLAVALRRARAAAALGPADERASLEHFRNALLPEWSRRTSLTLACRSDPWARSALSDLDSLRFAEEHALRYESVDLAPSRRRVQALEKILGVEDSPWAPALSTIAPASPSAHQLPE